MMPSCMDKLTIDDVFRAVILATLKASGNTHPALRAAYNKIIRDFSATHNGVSTILGKGAVECYDVLVRYTVGTRCIDVFNIMVRRT